MDSLIKLASEEHSPRFNEKNNESITSPLNATIITSDFIFFLENDAKSHEQGVHYFWNRMKNHFVNNQLSSVKLLIIQTESRIQMSSIKNTQTFHTIQHHLEILTTSSSLPESITMMLQMIQNHPISFTRIVRSWIRQSLPNPYITLLLPQLNGDKSTCTLSLVLEYTLFPFPLNSAYSWRMIQHCKSIENSNWKVRQIMYFSNVNASLIYDTPMVAKAGMKENYDLTEYREMQHLVQELWRYLKEKEAALLLSCTCKDCGDDLQKSGQEDFFILTVNDEGGNYSALEGRNKVNLHSRKNNFLQGVLFRYAINEQLLWDVENEQEIIHDKTEDYQYRGEVSQQYYDFIEQSLECVKGKEFNPILLGNTYFDKSSNFSAGQMSKQRKESENNMEKSPGHDNRARLSLMNADLQKWDIGNEVGIDILTPSKGDKKELDQEGNTTKTTSWDDMCTDAMEIFDYM